jgi:hypothetical protein
VTAIQRCDCGCLCLFDNGQVDEGAAFVYLGNEVNGKRNNLRLYNSNLTSIINQSNVIDDEFGTGFYAKSFLGRNNGKLVIEAKKDGQGFSKASNNSITNSVQSTRAQANFSNLGTAGTELKSLVTKVASLSTKVRVRVKYDPVLAITGQMYGPWRYMPGYLSGAGTHNNIPLPVELLYFDAILNAQKIVDISWATASELNNAYFVVQRSEDAINWETLTVVDGAGNSSELKMYKSKDNTPFSGTSYYRLQQVDIDGKISFSDIKVVKINEDNDIVIYPNPITDACTVEIRGESDVPFLVLYDSNGRLQKNIATEGKKVIIMDMASLPKGVYYLHSDNNVLLSKLVKQ